MAILVPLTDPLILVTNAYAPAVSVGPIAAELAGPLTFTTSMPSVTAAESDTYVILSQPLIFALSPLKPCVPTLVTEARDRDRLEPVYLVEITLRNSAPDTLYLSDRRVEIGGRIYEDYLEGLTGLGAELHRAGDHALNADITLTFRNDRFSYNETDYGFLIEIGDTFPFEGADCTIKEVCLDTGGTASNAETIFKGVLEEPHNIDLMRFRCRVSSTVHQKDREWVQSVIESSTFPNAYEDLGRIIPFVYGSDIQMPAYRTDWGARDTLLSDINDSVTTIELSDAARFPASGSVIINNEEISYTGRSGNQLTGCTRGAGGTGVTKHLAATVLWQKQTYYWSVLAAHELHTVGDIFAELDGRLWRVTSGVSAVFTGGMHYLRASEQIRVKAVQDDIAVSDTIAVNDTIDVDNAYASTQKTVTRWCTNLPFQLVSTLGSRTIDFPSAPSGSLADVIMTITWEVVITSNPSAAHTFRLDGSSGDKIVTVNTDGTLINHMSNTIDIYRGTWATWQYINSSRNSSGVFFNIISATQRAVITSAFSGDPAGGRVSRSATSLPEQWNDWAGTRYLTFPSAPSGNLTDIYVRYSIRIGVTSNPTSRITLKIDGSSGKVLAYIETDGSITWNLPSTFYYSYNTTWDTWQGFYSSSSSGTWTLTVEVAEEFAITDVEESVDVVTKTGSASKSGSVTKSGSVVATHAVDRFHAVVSGYKDPDGNYGGAGSILESPAYDIKHFLVNKTGYSLSEIDDPSFNSAASAMASAVSAGYKWAFVVDEDIRPSEFLMKMAHECRSTLKYEGGKWYLDFVPGSAPSALATISKGELAGSDGIFRFSKTPVTGIANDITIKYRRIYSRMTGETEWLDTLVKADSASKTKYGTYPKAICLDLIRDNDTASDVGDLYLLEKKEPLLIVEFPVFWEHFDLKRGDTIKISNDIYNDKKFFLEAPSKLRPDRIEWKARSWWDD